jgi:hypothetical protein
VIIVAGGKCLRDSDCDTIITHRQEL